jgi:transcriptional regulator with XRE-family HTH domain
MNHKQISSKTGPAAVNLHWLRTRREAVIKYTRSIFAFTPELGAKLRALRKQRNLSMKGLAAMMGRESPGAFNHLAKLEVLFPQSSILLPHSSFLRPASRLDSSPAPAIFSPVGTPAPDAVKRLVDRFDQDRKVFLSPDYKEEQLRANAGHQAKVEEKPEVRKAGGVRARA